MQMTDFSRDNKVSIAKRDNAPSPRSQTTARRKTKFFLWCLISLTWQDLESSETQASGSFCEGPSLNLGSTILMAGVLDSIAIIKRRKWADRHGSSLSASWLWWFEGKWFHRLTALNIWSQSMELFEKDWDEWFCWRKYSLGMGFEVSKDSITPSVLLSSSCSWRCELWAFPAARLLPLYHEP